MLSASTGAWTPSTREGGEGGGGRAAAGGRRRDCAGWPGVSPDENPTYHLTGDGVLGSPAARACDITTIVGLHHHWLPPHGYSAHHQLAVLDCSRPVAEEESEDQRRRVREADVRYIIFFVPRRASLLLKVTHIYPPPLRSLLLRPRAAAL